MQQREKVRVYILARELDIDTADLLRMCKQAGFDVKNQLSSLDHDQQIALEEMVKKGAKPGSSPPSVPAKPVTKVVSPDEKPVPNLTASRSVRPTPAPVVVAPPVPAPVAEVAPTPPPPPARIPEPVAPIETPTPTIAAKPAVVAPPAPKPFTPAPLRDRGVPNLSSKPAQPSAGTPAKPAVTSPAAVSLPPTPSPAPVAPPAPPANVPSNVPPPPPIPVPVAVVKQEPAAPSVSPPVAPPIPKTESPRGPVPPILPSKMPPQAPVSRTPQDLNRRPTPSPSREGGGARPGMQPPSRRTDQPPPKKQVGSPSHLQHLKPIPPPSLKQQPKAQPPEGKVLKPLMTFTKEQLGQAKPMRIEDLMRPPGEPVVEEPLEDEESRDKKKKKVIPGRDERQKKRTARAVERKSATTGVELIDGKVLTAEEEQRVRGRRRHDKHKPLIKQRPTHLELEPPFTVRSLSEDLMVRSVELMFKLREHGASANLTINSSINSELAQLVALDFNCELKVLVPETDEDKILKDIDPPDQPEDLVLRAPVVTVMGHVDHGKTSLLDRIRRSNVAATEAGGITQVIRAWRVDHGGRPVTFLDTPGHEAFTKMRARGAQVTDVAVIVVAADDGVMPQTEEAISHAKAAGVSLVVAINKVDMPSSNVNRTRQQLYGLGVLPDNMGGDTPFVETSAATGKGIDELLDQLAIVAELKELKSNPKKHASGTCLEAMLSEGEGVRATLLVRDGTLRRGDVILCGSAFGRVRQMYNDLGAPIQEAGPSVPVRITGLDKVPEASDTFHVLDDINVAADIADRRTDKMRENSVTKRPSLTLERLNETKIDELKVILKADFRGSIEAIRKELEKLKHEEVAVRVLEAGIGAITENDVWLALASPDDTMIVGFNAVPDDRAMALAEERGVKIREYNIIYNLTNDIRAALEGKLKPREEVVHLGRAIVRETFKISRTGTIAGCYVTQGNIKRNAKVRVIRDGVVIYPPAERTAGLESLKRFKEDVGEVREGFECGIKVAGYDDIKVGDVIEAYRVEQVQRTLE